jgi:hypothetical protein
MTTKKRPKKRTTKRRTKRTKTSATARKKRVLRAKLTTARLAVNAALRAVK